jgi:NSS family neurotransmitter:Na+ symporter
VSSENSVHWSSRFAFLMAAMGSAVGLANIWRFPYTAGVSGGGAFVFIYIGAVLLLALPILIAELMIGRRGAAPPPRAISEVAIESGRSKNWGWIGIILGGIGAILTLSFYSIVGGWTLAYILKMGSGTMQGISADAAASAFESLNNDPITLFIWFSVFISVTIFVSARGIKAGVERVVKVMMPSLLVLLVLMVIYAMFVGDFVAALKFMFTPDFSKVNSGIVMAAFGQAFFSVSVGATNLMAYGSYMLKTTSIPRSALIVVAADTGVALLAGLAIFPIIFAFGLEPSAGPGVVFITMPFAFGQIPGGLIFGGVFFILLFFAALTSSISMMEAPVSWLSDRTRLSRAKAAMLSGGMSWGLGILAVLSLNIWSDFHPLGNFALFEGKTFFDLYDFIVTNVLLPFGGIVIAVFAGWVMKKKFSSDELYAGKPTIWYYAWLFLVRFVAPVILLGVFIDLLQ